MTSRASASELKESYRTKIRYTLFLMSQILLRLPHTVYTPIQRKKYL